MNSHSESQPSKEFISKTGVPFPTWAADRRAKGLNPAYQLWRTAPRLTRSEKRRVKRENKMVAIHGNGGFRFVRKADNGLLIKK